MNNNCCSIQEYLPNCELTKGLKGYMRAIIGSLQIVCFKMIYWGYNIIEALEKEKKTNHF